MVSVKAWLSPTEADGIFLFQRLILKKNHINWRNIDLNNFFLRWRGCQSSEPKWMGPWPMFPIICKSLCVHKISVVQDFTWTHLNLEWHIWNMCKNHFWREHLCALVSRSGCACPRAQLRLNISHSRISPPPSTTGIKHCRQASSCLELTNFFNNPY